MNFIKTKKFILCLCIIPLVFGIVLTGCSDKKEVTVDLKEKILCEAESVDGEIANSSFLTASIPPNAGITKIYVGVQQKPSTPIDGAFISIGPIFTHLFSKDPGDSIGSFESTLVQPLCVGPVGADIQITTLQEDSVTNSNLITVTVVSL